MSLEHSLLAPIQELERAYKFFNQRLFSEKLDEKIILTIQTRGRRTNALAWYWQQRWNADEIETIAELNFSAETIREHNPYESLIHEMVHHYCALRGIQDCSRNGNYHNKRFKEAAELAGLICEKDDRIGWAFTSLGTLAEQAIKDLQAKPDIFKYLRYPEGGKGMKKKRYAKWSCDCYNFWTEATNQIEAKCLKCGKVFFDC